MNTAVTRSEPAAQEVCIDLPGESVQCWRSGDHLKVVLRKHRDVIFDLHLGKGATYTVEATDSDFYSARDKKLVHAARKETVMFRDGERLHLWVTRGFKGALLLKSNGKVLMKVEPNELDRHQYNNDPKVKPAPIIVSLGNPSAAPQAVAAIPGVTPMGKASALPSSTSSAAVKSPMPPVPIAASAPVGDECSIVCVVEGGIEGMPQNVVDHFKKGGGKSGLANIDLNDVATRNWIWGQVAGSAAYVRDNWTWLRASLDSRTSKGFQLVSAKIHRVGGKVRFYFSGYSKFNTVFGPGGFGPGHERIMTIFAGVGKTSSTFASVLKGVAGTFKGNALVSFIFGSATAIAEWKDDLQKDGYDLAAALFMTVVKAIIAAVLVVAAVAVLVIFALAGGGISLSVIAIGAVTIAAGVLINYLVEAADKALGRVVTGDKKNTDGLSSVIAPALRKAGKQIQESWDYLMSKFPSDYSELAF